MHNLEIIIFLLGAIVLLSAIAHRIRVPFPILLVLVGLAIGLVPGLPPIQLDPDVVFLIFLPPLLFEAAWFTSWHDFKAAKRPISLLSIGCVLFTTTSIAAAAHYLIPGITWPLGFVLGAIISPPDAVAATSVTRGLGVPRSVLVILEGESLVNDASGLIAYKYAVAAVATGNFILWEAGVQFFVVSLMGVGIGVAVGYLVAKVLKNVKDNSTVDVSLTLLTPFIAFIISEHFHFSGVLAVVTSGLYLSWRSSELLTHKSRLQGVSVWNTVVFILNGIIFILIGLQLPIILKDISGFLLGSLIFYGIVISILLMLVRIIWVFPGAYLPRLSKRVRAREPDINWKLVSIVAWTGMRGVVSLAAALALPVTLANGNPFPQRDVILFLTFCVILFTLIFQGLSLPLLIKWLGIQSHNQEVLEEIEARKLLANAAILHIEENYGLGVLSEGVLAQVKSKYELRYNHLANYSRIKEEVQKEDEIFGQFRNAQQELLRIERSFVNKMRKEGAISDEVLRRLEYELDLEESRLMTEV